MAGNRDIIVVGASLGGVEALTTVAAGLPANLPAAVLVVQHMSEESGGLLPGILDRAGPLPAATGEDGMEIRPGRILVAPPGRHLLATADGVRVVFGPRENRSRPAIDPLFRTAAVNFRSRVIGVVLTGLLGDGAAGLLAVKRCGGAAVVQAPDDAAHPEMPRTALVTAGEAYQVALTDMAALLTRLARAPAPKPPPVPDGLRIEARLTERALKSDDWNEVPGRSTDFTCPECRGPIREMEEDGLVRYRCRVGHAYSLESLIAARDDSVEDALWVALQTLQERAQMLNTMAGDDEARGRARSSGSLRERAQETQAHAQRLRDLIARMEG